MKNKLKRAIKPKCAIKYTLRSRDAKTSLFLSTPKSNPEKYTDTARVHGLEYEHTTVSRKSLKEQSPIRHSLSLQESKMELSSGEESLYIVQYTNFKSGNISFDSSQDKRYTNDDFHNPSFYHNQIMHYSRRSSMPSALHGSSELNLDNLEIKKKSEKLDSFFDKPDNEQ